MKTVEFKVKKLCSRPEKCKSSKIHSMKYGISDLEFPGLEWTRWGDLGLIPHQKDLSTYIKQITFSEIWLTLNSFLLLTGTNLVQENQFESVKKSLPPWSISWPYRNVAFSTDRCGAGVGKYILIVTLLIKFSYESNYSQYMWFYRPGKHRMLPGGLI